MLTKKNKNIMENSMDPLNKKNKKISFNNNMKNINQSKQPLNP